MVGVCRLPLHGLLSSVDSDLHVLLRMAGVGGNVCDGGVVEEV